MSQHKGLIATIVVILIVALDQWLKIWVKTHFYLGEDLEIPVSYTHLTLPTIA